MLLTLYCLFTQCLYASMDIFPNIVFNTTKQGKSLIVFSDKSAWPIVSWPNINTYIVEDEKLTQYLAIHPESSVLIDIHKSGTDFDAYDIPKSFTWNGTKAWGNWPIKTFHQPHGINPILALEYTQNLVSKDLQMTVVYKNETMGALLSKKLNRLRKKFPTVKFRCWSLLHSDIDQDFGRLPALVASSAAHGTEIHHLKTSLLIRHIQDFIQSNIDHMKVFKSDL